jgi:hypothetical protein
VQLVRFIDHERIRARQQFGETVLLQRHVGQQQMMVDYQYVGIQRLLARLHQKAVIPVLAVAAEAVIRGRGHQRPHRRIFRDAVEFCDVASVGDACPLYDLLQFVLDFPADEAEMWRDLQSMRAQVVGAAFQQRGAHRHVQRLQHPRNVRLEELVL